MITLYDNPFSPFTRKVRMALNFKQVAFESVDALALSEHERLVAVNPRAEVPVLIDDDVTVVNSADIVAYIDERFPSPPLLPPSPVGRAKARAWQRTADTILDAIVHDISLWVWPTHQRTDDPPAGLIEAGRRDIEKILADLDASLADSHFLCGAVSVADLALFPHISSLRVLGIPVEKYESVVRWNTEMRQLPAVRADLGYVKRSAAEAFGGTSSRYEGEKVIWRGDRIEWLLAKGFHEFFAAEVAGGRAVIPRSLG